MSDNSDIVIELGLMIIPVMVFLVIVIAAVFIFKKKTSPSPSPGSSSGGSPPPKSSIVPYFSPPPPFNPPASLTPYQQFLAYLATFGIMVEEMVIQEAAMRALQASATIFDTIRDGIIKGKAFSESLKSGLSKITPKVAKFIINSAKSSEILAYLSELGIRAIKTLIAKAGSEEAALSVLQQVADSGKSGDVALALDKALANAGLRAGNEAGIAASTISKINELLLGITIVNGVFSFMNIGHYEDNNFTGNFLQIKANLDSQQDNANWFSSFTYPIYWGPLDDIYGDDPMFPMYQGSPSSTSSQTVSPYLTDLATNIVTFLSIQLDKFEQNIKTNTNTYTVDPVALKLFTAILGASPGSSPVCTTKSPSPSTGSPTVPLNPPVPYIPKYDNSDDIAAVQAAYPDMSLTAIQNAANLISLDKLLTVFSDCDITYLNNIALNNMCIKAGGISANDQGCSYNKTSCLANSNYLNNYPDAPPGSSPHSSPGLKDTAYLEFRELSYFDKLYPGRSMKQPKPFFAETSELPSPDTGSPNLTWPEGYCITRSPRMRQDCDEKISTGSGSNSSHYNISTGICTSTQDICNSTNTEYNFNTPLNQLGPIGTDCPPGDVCAPYGVILPPGYTALPSCVQKPGMDVAAIILGGSFIPNAIGSLVDTHGRALGNWFWSSQVGNIAAKYEGPNAPLNYKIQGAFLIACYEVYRFVQGVDKIAVKVSDNIYNSLVHLNKMVYAKVSQGIAKRLGNTQSAKIFGSIVGGIVVGLADLYAGVLIGGIVMAAIVIHFANNPVVAALTQGVAQKNNQISSGEHVEAGANCSIM
jgi:hypothetical protein